MGLQCTPYFRLCPSIVSINFVPHPKSSMRHSTKSAPESSLTMTVCGSFCLLNGGKAADSAVSAPAPVESDNLEAGDWRGGHRLARPPATAHLSGSISHRSGKDRFGGPGEAIRFLPQLALDG